MVWAQLRFSPTPQQQLWDLEVPNATKSVFEFGNLSEITLFSASIGQRALFWHGLLQFLLAATTLRQDMLFLDGRGFPNLVRPDL